MKIRLDKSLLARAQACAMEVEMPLSRWASLAMKEFANQAMESVATGKKMENATRDGSVVCTLPGTPEQRQVMREALLLAVEHCDRVRPKPFKTNLVEGKDYVVVNRKDPK